MADTVQYLLEEQIPELEEYERKGYFSKAELKQIIQKRQDFEYRLKRRAALKQDFYRYIEYEFKLDKLRKYRKNKLGIKGKKSLADTAIIKRIHFVFERATRKFKSDLQLWLDWLRCCRKTKSSKQHSKVVTKALQRHATATVLWIEAATWEFERSGNVAAARALMQQGLRMCKHEPAMWVEYMRMELLYIHRLRVRREVLGLDAPGEDAEPKAGGSAMDPEAASNAVLNGAVARIVYKNAVAAIPGSLAMRKSMLEVLRGFSFSGIKPLVDHVYSTIAADFPEVEEAWDLLASRPLAPAAAEEGSEPGPAPGAHAAVVEVYERAVAAVKTARMYGLYAAYLEARLEALMVAAAAAEAGGEQGLPSSSGREQPASRRGKRAKVSEQAPAFDAVATAGAELLSVYMAAHNAHCASAALYLHWVQWAQKLGQAKMATGAARHACLRHPTHVELWLCRLRMEQPAELLKTLQEASATVPADESADLWLHVLEAIPLDHADFARLVEQLVVAVTGATSGPISGGLGHVAAAFLQKIRSAQGLEAARRFYQRFLALPAPGGEFFHSAISMERAEEEASSTPSTSGSVSKSKGRRVKQLFEAAVASYGSKDPEIWLAYAQYEASRLQGGGSIYWRATKALDDPDPFIISYRQQVQEV